MVRLFFHSFLPMASAWPASLALCIEAWDKQPVPLSRSYYLIGMPAAVTAARMRPEVRSWNAVSISG